jgi:hypothetical protein
MTYPWFEHEPLRWDPDTGSTRCFRCDKPVEPGNTHDCTPDYDKEAARLEQTKEEMREYLRSLDKKK